MTQTNKLNRQYERALAYYTNINNYNCETELGYKEGVAQLVNAGPVRNDNGKRARKVLKENEHRAPEGRGYQYRRALMVYANTGLYKHENGVFEAYKERARLYQEVRKRVVARYDEEYASETNRENMYMNGVLSGLDIAIGIINETLAGE